MRIESNTRLLLIVVLALLLLAGCGQKGPLRLPDPPADAPPKATAADTDPTALAARRANPHE